MKSAPWTECNQRVLAEKSAIEAAPSPQNDNSLHRGEIPRQIPQLWNACDFDFAPHRIVDCDILFTSFLENLAVPFAIHEAGELSVGRDLTFRTG